MYPALAQVTARRCWFVPGFVVWGLPSWEEVDCLLLEQGEATKTILFASFSLGDATQHVAFADLTDHRGNQLPANIASPRVIVRPRSEETAFIVGEESNSSFTIARRAETPSPVTVDLLIVEMD